ncbi:MAG TPA: hypothetical protein VL095_00010 [Flavisolibacter sp.]|nr:hypothetical protein [Flavisolibacter sp.]
MNIMKKPDKWVQSACLLCSNGCGMDTGVKDGRITGVRGCEQPTAQNPGNVVQDQKIAKRKRRNR